MLYYYRLVPEIQYNNTIIHLLSDSQRSGPRPPGWQNNGLQVAT